MIKNNFSFFVLLIIFSNLMIADFSKQTIEATGYLALQYPHHEEEIFLKLYELFDILTLNIENNSSIKCSLIQAQNQFIKSADNHLYDTIFFGLHDQKSSLGPNQISFYYCTHFHNYINDHYPTLKSCLALQNFLNFCNQIAMPYYEIFQDVAQNLALENIFTNNQPAILLKIIKYFPSYQAHRPHYDGTIFSLFAHSTNNDCLLLAPYAANLTCMDFHPIQRKKPNDLILIPGTDLFDHGFLPTPHIVAHVDTIRFATIAFALSPQKNKKKILQALPIFKKK